MVNLASKLYDYIQKNSSPVGYYYEIQETISFLGDLSGKDILEVGAGTCKVSAFIKNKFPTANVVASDISKSHLEMGSKKAKIETIVSPTEEIHKKLSKKFDIIISNDTLHHHTNRILALKNCYHLLKEGGVLLIRDVGRLSPGFTRYNILDKADFVSSKLQGLRYVSPSYFSKEEFIDLLRCIGFRSFTVKGLKIYGLGLIIIVAKK